MIICAVVVIYIAYAVHLLPPLYKISLYSLCNGEICFVAVERTDINESCVNMHQKNKTIEEKTEYFAQQK